jgi:hypothetical protein
MWIWLTQRIGANKKSNYINCDNITRVVEEENGSTICMNDGHDFNFDETVQEIAEKLSKGS